MSAIVFHLPREVRWLEHLVESGWSPRSAKTHDALGLNELHFVKVD